MKCDKSKITSSTKNVCLVLESLGSTTEEELELALCEMQTLVATFCGGKSCVRVLDTSCRSLLLE